MRLVELNIRNVSNHVGETLTVPNSNEGPNYHLWPKVKLHKLRLPGTADEIIPLGKVEAVKVISFYDIQPDQQYIDGPGVELQITAGTSDVLNQTVTMAFWQLNQVSNRKNDVYPSIEEVNASNIDDFIGRTVQIPVGYYHKQLPISGTYDRVAAEKMAFSSDWVNPVGIGKVERLIDFTIADAWADATQFAAPGKYIGFTAFGVDLSLPGNRVGIYYKPLASTAISNVAKAEQKTSILQMVPTWAPKLAIGVAIAGIAFYLYKKIG